MNHQNLNVKREIGSRFCRAFEISSGNSICFHLNNNNILLHLMTIFGFHFITLQLGAGGGKHEHLKTIID